MYFTIILLSFFICHKSLRSKNSILDNKTVQLIAHCFSSNCFIKKLPFFKDNPRDIS